MFTVQGGNSTGFVEEPLHCTLVLDDLSAEHFERHDALDQVLFGSVDDPHPALADSFQDCVPIIQDLADQILVHGGDEVRAVIGALLHMEGVLLEAFGTVFHHVIGSLK